MGGLPCAKQVLDQREALEQKLGCMSNSILLNAGETQPTEDQLDRFLIATNDLAKVASEIQDYVAKGA